MNRICMHMPSASGGHPRYVRELMNAMVRRAAGEFEFELVSSVDLEEHFDSPIYKVHRLLPPLRKKSTFPNRLAWVANRAAHYPRRELAFLKWLRSRPDIDIVHFQEFNVWMPWFQQRIRAMGKKIFYTAHFVRPHAYAPIVPPALWNGRHRMACRRCDSVFVLSERVRDELLEFLGPERPPVLIAPHGVWTVPSTARITPLSQRLAERRLLFFGTMRRDKGLDLVLDAMPQLSEYQLTIAGLPLEKDYFYNEVMPKVRSLQSLGSKIEVIDRFIPDQEVASLMARHSAILLPYTEQFTAQSGVIFLALAYEIPAVCSKEGGLQDIAHESPIGTIFTQRTAAAFVAAVRELFGNNAVPELANQIRLAKNRCSWWEAARVTLDAYSSALHEHHKTHDAVVPAILS